MYENMYEDAHKEQDAPSIADLKKMNRQRLIVICAFLSIFLVLTFLRTGEKSEKALSWQDGVFSLNFSDGSSYSTPVDEIISVQMIYEPDFGEMISGQNKSKTAWGIWKNDSAGEYVRYSYFCSDPVIQIESKEYTFWISYESEDTTELLFGNITQELVKASQGEE